MLDYKKIGEKIRFLRKNKNLSQEQLAEKVWISTTHMSHIETGATKLSLPVLVDLANALGVGTDEILSTQLSLEKAKTGDTVQQIMSKCTPQQARILEEIVKSAKAAMDAYMP